MAEHGHRVRHQLANHRVLTLWEAVLLTAASAVLPGVAHLYAGMRRTGTVLLGAYGLVIAVAVVAVVVRPELLQPGHSPAVTLAAGVFGGVWGVVVIWSYLLLRPPGMALLPRIAGVAAVAVVCVLVGLPALALVGDQRTTAPTGTTLTGRTQDIPSSPAPTPPAVTPTPTPSPTPSARPSGKRHRPARPHHKAAPPVVAHHPAPVPAHPAPAHHAKTPAHHAGRHPVPAHRQRQDAPRDRRADTNRHHR